MMEFGGIFSSYREEMTSRRTWVFRNRKEYSPLPYSLKFRSSVGNLEENHSRVGHKRIAPRELISWR